MSSLDRSSLSKLRADFGRCVDCAEKQIGLRRLATARQLLSSAPAEALELYSAARQFLVRPGSHRAEALIMRKLLLSSVLAIAALSGVARADLPPLTIDMVRTSAAIGMAPLVSDVERLSKCPGMTPKFPDEMYSDASAMDEARRLRIPVGAIWLRRNDAAIERCLKN